MHGNSKLNPRLSSKAAMRRSSAVPPRLPHRPRRASRPLPAVAVVGQRVGDTATLPCIHRCARRVAMSLTSTVAQSPRTVVRAMRRIPVKVVEIAEGEGVNGFKKYEEEDEE